MSEDVLISQYRMLLWFYYNDKSKLIQELEDMIKLYETSSKSEEIQCRKRINVYRSIIDLAKNDK